MQSLCTTQVVYKKTKKPAQGWLFVRDTLCRSDGDRARAPYNHDNSTIRSTGAIQSKFEITSHLAKARIMIRLCDNARISSLALAPLINRQPVYEIRVRLNQYPNNYRTLDSVALLLRSWNVRCHRPNDTGFLTSELYWYISWIFDKHIQLDTIPYK